MSEGLTLLLVEDEAIIALARARKLEKAGYRVIRALTGEEGVQLALEENPGIILMDIDLGEGIDGGEAARQILAERDIPVVFLSSHTEEEVVRRSEAITSYGYVAKNSPQTILETSLRMALRLHQAYGDQQEAFEQIARQEVTYRLIFENAPVGILHFNAQGIITQCNNAFIKIIGSSREKLEGLDMTRLPDAMLGKALRKALDGNIGYYSGEYHSVTAEKVTPVEGLFAPYREEPDNREGFISGGVGIFQDMSREAEARKARKAALEEVKRSEAFARSLIELAPDAFFLGNPRGIIIECNKKALDLTGYTEEEIIGQPIRILFTQEELGRVPLNFEDLRKGLIIRNRRKLRRKGGAEVDIDMNTRMMPDGRYQTFIREV